jgi:hypothetical protein
MATDQGLLELAGGLLQTIAKTQENLGEMLKMQKQQNKMNHKVLQDTLRLQKEVKSIVKAISKGEKSGSMKKHSSNRPIKRRSRWEDSKEIEHANMKQTVKCWKCGGDHCLRNCPTRKPQEGSSRKIFRLMDELEDPNQREHLVKVKGLGPESSK